MEMEQLLNMGFSQELAVQALAATGGKSTLKATEWILTTHKSNNTATPIPNPDPNFNPLNPSPFQPKLDRFFQTKSPRSLDIRSNEGTKEATTTFAGVKQSNDDCEEKSPPKRLKLWPFQKQSFPPPLSPSPSPSPSPLQNTPHEPLSERMRPRSIDDVIGQDHLLGRNSVLRSSLDSERLPSLVLWGPPGTGKTSIARAIAHSAPTSYRFVSLSAVTSGVKDVREAVEEARKMKKKNKRTLLFIDEVHRFNKAQQDSFLPVIEDGSVVFIGATTENPSFHLITPLLSRCRVFTLNPLQPQNIVKLLKQAANDTEKGLARSVGVSVVVEEEAFDFLSLHCDGDARVALNALEISATTAAARRNHGHSSSSSSSKEEGNSGSGDRRTGCLITAASIDGDEKCGIPVNGGSGVGSSAAIVTIDDVKEALQCKHLAYDRAGDEHYNLISALHKSMRGSDADASIYWLARMLEGGEEPLYIARRLIRFASEDVGLADPTALNQSVACHQACHFLGMPECNVILAQCVTYLALAPKSVAVYEAIKAAQKVVKESGGQNEGVPLHLRNAPTKLMKDIGYAKGYIYPPSDPTSASLQSYLPPSLQGYKFLNWPTNNADR